MRHALPILFLGSILAVSAQGAPKKGVSLDDLTPRKPTKQPAPQPKSPRTKTAPRKVAPVVKAPVAPKPAPAFIVAQAGGTPYRTIASALKQAPAGARILVRSGTYAENLVVSKPVEIFPEKPEDLVTVVGGGQPCLLMKTTRATVRRVTLRLGPGANPADYAVELPQGQLLLDDCTVGSGAKACVGAYGGATRATLRNCRLKGEKDGLLVFSRAEVAVEGGSLSSNAGAGAKISGHARLTIKGCRVAENGGSGVEFSDEAGGLVEDCDLSQNRLQGVLITTRAHPLLRNARMFANTLAGVAVADSGSGELQGCDIYRNAGAGIYTAYAGKPTVRGCKIRLNLSQGFVAENGGDGLIEDSDVLENVGYGIAVQSGSNLTARRCRVVALKLDTFIVIQKSRATAEGCDLSKLPGEAAVVAVNTESQGSFRRCKIRGGRVGVYAENGGAPSVDDCDISDADDGVHLTGSGSKGQILGSRIYRCRKAGIFVFNFSSAIIERCDVYGNGTDGLLIRQGATATVTKCTFRESKGAGIHINEASGGTIVDCDIRENLLAGIGLHARSNPTFRMCRVTAGKGASGDGVWAADQALGLFEDCVVEANASSGVTILRGANPTFRRCRISGNVGPGILSRDAGQGIVEESDVLRNRGGSIVMRDSSRVAVRASRTD